MSEVERLIKKTQFELRLYRHLRTALLAIVIMLAFFGGLSLIG